jgi:hypothetical protein
MPYEQEAIDLTQGPHGYSERAASEPGFGDAALQPGAQGDSTAPTHTVKQKLSKIIEMSKSAIQVCQSNVQN